MSRLKKAWADAISFRRSVKTCYLGHEGCNARKDGIITRGNIVMKGGKQPYWHAPPPKVSKYPPKMSPESQDKNPSPGNKSHWNVG